MRITAQNAIGGCQPYRVLPIDGERIDRCAVHRDRNEMMSVKASDAAIGDHPHASVGSGLHVLHVARRKSFVESESHEAICVVAIDTVLRGHPQETGGVLCQSHGGEIAQSRFRSVASEWADPRR